MPPKKQAAKRKGVSDPFENKEELFEGKRYFKDPKIISEHLICGICQEVFDEPWRLTCGHSFCKACLDPWLLTNMTCPVDRLPINMNFSHKDLLVANIIGDYMIACPWRPFGCVKIDKYYIVKDHKDKCPHNPNKMDKVMQQAALKLYNERPESPMFFNTPSPRASKKKPNAVSALDELMNDLGDDALDMSYAESEDNNNHLPPEPEMLPLSMRMYINGDDNSKKFVCQMLEKSDETATSSTGKKPRKPRKVVPKSK